MAYFYDKPCIHCGDKPSSKFDPHGWLCLECAAELIHGIIPPFSKITSGKRQAVPRGEQPGTGEGNDYFGNHT